MGDFDTAGEKFEYAVVVYYKRNKAHVNTIVAQGHDPHDRELEDAVEDILYEQQGIVTTRAEMPAVPLHICRGRENWRTELLVAINEKRAILLKWHHLFFARDELIDILLLQISNKKM